MQEIKNFYWGEGLDDYVAFNHPDYNQIIEIKRLNFFIGKNNAGKSRFLRSLYPCKASTSAFNKYNYSKSFFKELTEDFLDQLKSKNIVTYENKECGPIAEQFKSLRDRSDELIDSDEKFTNFAEQNACYFTYYKYYIPTLRGLRNFNNLQSIDNSHFQYKERTIKDYFRKIEERENANSQDDFALHESEKVNLQKTVITGEDFYETLSHYSNGEEHQWSMIEDYEKILSKYFFDNKRVKLTAKNNKEVPHYNKTVDIKIGDEPQLPIYHLGDGLQQVIILTYQAFITKKETNAFFIEEPELHMHAGMLRQLMNFYLNETDHYYFFTTHSNHLLDMADESDQVIIQKFVKKPKTNEPKKFSFEIHRCDRDRDLLASLGVKPSSVYLANCTIWVEGITDRLYITKYMEKYLNDLKKSTIQEEQQRHSKHQRFMPNYHYAFIEYAGSNLTHWNFSDNSINPIEDKGLSAKSVVSDILLIADGDIKSKKSRVNALYKDLKENQTFILNCKETENTLPKDSIICVAKNRFSRMKNETKAGFYIDKLDHGIDDLFFFHKKHGIGKLLDDHIRTNEADSKKTVFADGTGVGTIKSKLGFCRDILSDFDANPDWTLTDEAKKICEEIFKHIERCNA